MASNCKKSGFCNLLILQIFLQVVKRHQDRLDDGQNVVGESRVLFSALVFGKAFEIMKSVSF